MTDSATKIIEIPDVCILPFGIPSSVDAFIMDPGVVKSIAFAANGIYLASSRPVAVIHKNKTPPITIDDAEDLFADRLADVVAYSDDECPTRTLLVRIREVVQSYFVHPFQTMFLDGYFENIIRRIPGHFYPDRKTGEPPEDVHWQSFGWLLPIPELQVYVRDPLDQTANLAPEKTASALISGSGMARRSSAARSTAVSHLAMRAM